MSGAGLAEQCDDEVWVEEEAGVDAVEGQGGDEEVLEEREDEEFELDFFGVRVDVEEVDVVWGEVGEEGSEGGGGLRECYGRREAGLFRVGGGGGGSRSGAGGGRCIASRGGSLLRLSFLRFGHLWRAGGLEMVWFRLAILEALLKLDAFFVSMETTLVRFG